MVEPQSRYEAKGTVPGGQATIGLTLTRAGAATSVSTEFEYQLPGGLFSGVLEKLAAGAIERDLQHSSENSRPFARPSVRTTA